MGGYHFKKMHARYPLKTFDAYLKGRVADRTRHAYVCSMRQLFFAVEKSAEQYPPPWRDFDHVLDHYQRLKRRSQNALQAAWGQWIAFMASTTQETFPMLGLGGERRPRGLLAAALQILTEDATFSNRYEFDNVLEFVWRINKEFKSWYVMDNKGRCVWLSAKMSPLLTTVREWAYPPPGMCHDGALFLPNAPHADVPMSESSLYKLLDAYSKYNANEHRYTLHAAMRDAEVAAVRPSIPTQAPTEEP